ncbi:hypothetical protein Tco_0312941 [Tanacetum coccineum]
MDYNKTNRRTEKITDLADTLIERYTIDRDDIIRANIMAIKESKDLNHYLLMSSLESQVHEMIIKKDSEIVKAKVERKSLALKAKKEFSNEECSSFGSKDEEYAIAVRDFKKFFKRRGRFMRHPQNDKKTFQRSRDDKKGKSERKCFRCGESVNHRIGECLSHERQEPKSICWRFLER